MSPIFSPVQGIHTAAGRYLRRVAYEDAPAHGEKPTSATRHVWEIAFQLAVRRRFEPDSPLAEIRRTVSTILKQHASAALPPLAAEMLIRDALDETVPVDEISDPVRSRAHLLLFAGLVDELAMTDGELESLIVEAEELAVDAIANTVRNQ
ncbi:hypothetical protein [Paractinoplanes brasiliensis]|uniref:Uncharacterized protein n=1 Tax=Paractinoplanes brasiliensis TaxID=52695 RepID=A0A4R6JZR9_9ACTN|nr:hypothetical protein [Actinoplanes brasiliensis]TDO40345.1 hypothetical protein C8E87_4057 [Actinoplanes brasiliensis]GID25410.1 hypothetical protein Abr02nite_03930 [Actinoplanes brasiliensis]